MIRMLCRRDKGPVEIINEEALAASLNELNNVVWIDLSLSSDTVKQAGEFLTKYFQFHPLALEDALLESHLARVDDWQKYLYMAFHSLEYKDHEIRQSELDLFLGPNYLVTIHFDSIEPLNKLWDACAKGIDTRQLQTADRLLYHLFDKITTTTMQVVECLDDALDELEQQIYIRPKKAQLSQVFRTRRTVLQLRRIFGSQREAMNRLARDPFGVVHPENRVYFRDIYDHLVRMHELSDGLRDMAAGALEAHVSVTSYRMNEVMKTLTVVTVLFMPLTFITGYFGMNFFGDQYNIGNLFYPWYLFAITMILMIMTPIVMLYWMRRRGWLNSQLSTLPAEKSSGKLP
jgi:magnesium transporter